MRAVIRNKASLRTSRAAGDALSIITAGMGAANTAERVSAVISDNTVKIRGRSVDLASYGRVCVIAYGKAAGPMAESAEHNAKISDGVVVIPTSAPAPRLGSKYRILRSTHPTPSSRSARAADALLERVGMLGSGDYVIFLVSGGGSAMLTAPLNVTLSDKIRTNDILIKSGADIGEINCVRRQLSRIKGGGLVRDLKCNGVALIMSDVRGDKPYDVASGCTQAAPTTFADALDVLRKYLLVERVPRRVFSALSEGARAGSLKPRHARRITNVIIASNSDCVRAMVKKAQSMGYAVSTDNSYGNVDAAAQRIVKKLRREPMSCVVFGGEPTVKVRGRGRGGRNQELVARILTRTRSHGLVVASVGTDGIDGNTRAAGALAESPLAPRSEIVAHIRHSDSNSLFARYGRLVMTGPTGTNLQDIGVLLRRA